MTEPNTSWRTPADNELPVPGLVTAPLPLKSGEWNTMQIERTSQGLTFTLNGERILQQPLDLSYGEVFGLFHHTDKSSMRARNIRLDGTWHEKLPEDILATQ